VNIGSCAVAWLARRGFKVADPERPKLTTRAAVAWLAVLSLVLLGVVLLPQVLG
jgi:hypothetical protein